jgi:hypothetical protein
MAMVAWADTSRGACRALTTSGGVGRACEHTSNERLSAMTPVQHPLIIWFAAT